MLAHLQSVTAGVRLGDLHGRVQGQDYLFTRLTPLRCLISHARGGTGLCHRTGRREEQSPDRTGPSRVLVYGEGRFSRRGKAAPWQTTFNATEGSYLRKELGIRLIVAGTIAAPQGAILKMQITAKRAPAEAECTRAALQRWPLPLIHHRYEYLLFLCTPNLRLMLAPSPSRRDFGSVS